MALFRYEAVDRAGELVHGEMEGVDAAAVVQRLQEAGHLPISASLAFEQKTILKKQKRQRLKRRERAAFIRELACLVRAGLALDGALQAIAGASHEPFARRLAERLREDVRAGHALSEALAAREGAFDAFHVGMVRAAEASGKLHAGLERLAEHEERQALVRERLASALVYPALLASVAGGSLLLILAYVVPQFRAMFADAGQALPLPTQVVIDTATFLRDQAWLLAAGLAVALLAAQRYVATPGGRYRRDSFALRLPLAGTLVRAAQMARFSRALAALLGSGVPLLAALPIVKELLSNRVLADALDLAADALRSGGGLAAPLASTGLFPALGLQMIGVGEQTGRLEEMLDSVAQLYEREVGAALERMLAVLEPALIVGMGALIAGTILSLLVALMAIHDLPL